MGKFIQEIKKFILVLLSFGLVYAMDPLPKSLSGPSSPRQNIPQIPLPATSRKKNGYDCVRTFQLFNTERARQHDIPLSDIVPHHIIITPDEKGVVAALGNGQVIFKKIVDFDNSIELVADGEGGNGAAIISTGLREFNDEIVIAFAVNHKKKFFYDGNNMTKFFARFEIWSKKNPYGKNTFFTQERIKRLEHRLQDIAINARGAHIVATIEFPKPFIRDNRSSLVIYDLQTNQVNAQWSGEGRWFSNLVISDDGDRIACCDAMGSICLFDVKKVDTGITLSPQIAIQTQDVISQINYPSKIMLWYVTDDHQLKELDVRKYLGTIDAKSNITNVFFEEISSGKGVFVMENCPKLSVAYWQLDSEDAHGTIFFRRAKDIFNLDGNFQKMTCVLGQSLSGNFSYRNNAGQRIVESSGILAVALRGNHLVAVTKSGKMKVYSLIERCGLVIQKSKSDSFAIKSRRAEHKTMNINNTKSSLVDTVGKALSLDNLTASQERERKTKRINSLPPHNCLMGISTRQKSSKCNDSKKGKMAEFSCTDQVLTEYQKALVGNIFADFVVEDDDNEKPKGK